MARLSGVPMEERYTVNEITGCWIYRGSIDSEGYGRYGSRVAHRVYYEALVGPVPAELDLDHLCVRRNCVNPNHLEPVTPAENQLRGIPYRALERRIVQRSVCSKGHEISDEFSYMAKRTNARGEVYEVRTCRTCKRLNDQIRRARKKAAKRTA